MARVLIVEDDKDAATLLVRRLRTYGHIPITAPSGPLAMKAVGFDFPIDIVVMDVTLPGMDGFELLDNLRRHPELDNPKLPCVFLSGTVTAENVARAKALGAAYLTKPFVSGELQGAILHSINASISDELATETDDISNSLPALDINLATAEFTDDAFDEEFDEEELDESEYDDEE